MSEVMRTTHDDLIPVQWTAHDAARTIETQQKQLEEAHNVVEIMALERETLQRAVAARERGIRRLLDGLATQNQNARLLIMYLSSEYARGIVRQEIDESEAILLETRELLKDVGTP